MTLSNSTGVAIYNQALKPPGVHSRDLDRGLGVKSHEAKSVFIWAFT